MRASRQGFTLFELILVLTLIVILGAVSYPTLEAMYGGFKSTAAADAVRTCWAQARAKAMNDGIPYRFSVVPGKGNYRLAPDTGEFWSSNGATPSATDPANPPLVLEMALPKGVRFNTPKAVQAGDTGGDPADTVLAPGTTDNTSWTTVAVFLPDGTARTDAEVVLLTAGARPLVMRMRGLTGFVTSRPM